MQQTFCTVRVYADWFSKHQYHIISHLSHKLCERIFPTPPPNATHLAHPSFSLSSCKKMKKNVPQEHRTTEEEEVLGKMALQCERTRSPWPSSSRRAGRAGQGDSAGLGTAGPVGTSARACPRNCTTPPTSRIFWRRCTSMHFSIQMYS